MDLVSALGSAVLQVLVFAAAPFGVHLLTTRRGHGFLRSVGLFGPPRRSLRPTLCCLGLVGVVALLLDRLPVLRPLTESEASTSARFQGLEVTPTTVLVLLAIALVQTAFAEELFFRGFLGPLLIRRLGFAMGNGAQSGLFAAPHLLLFALSPSLETSAAAVVTLVCLTAVIGWVLGWLTSRAADGSIIPAVALHGLSNTTAYAFVLLS